MALKVDEKYWKEFLAKDEEQLKKEWDAQNQSQKNRSREQESNPNM